MARRGLGSPARRVRHAVFLDAGRQDRPLHPPEWPARPPTPRDARRSGGPAGGTTPGAFDDPADFARHDLIGAARHGNPYGSTPLFMDVGREDGFRFADEQLADELRAHGARLTFRLEPGGHGGYRGRMAEYLRFYANALERCRTSRGGNGGSR